MKRLVSLLFMACLFAACKKDSSGTPNPTPANTAPPVNVTVAPSTAHQTITGFGGANRMWGTQSLKPAEAQKAFGLGDGELGLSI